MSELIANILIFFCGIVIARWIFGIDQGLKLKKTSGWLTDTYSQEIRSNRI